MTAMPPQTLSLNDALQQALTHHQAGRLTQAEQLYRAILQAHPDQPDANHNLGVLAGQVGQPVAGLPFLKNALIVSPGHLQYVVSYATALLVAGQPSDAIAILREASERGLDAPSLQALRQSAEAAVATANAVPAENQIEQTHPTQKSTDNVSLADLLTRARAASHSGQSGKKGKSAHNR